MLGFAALYPTYFYCYMVVLGFALCSSLAAFIRYILRIQ